MNDYLAHVQALRNHLTTIGEAILEPELVSTVIGGLGAGNESLATSMTTRFNRSITFLDLEAILMDYELSNP